MVPSEPCCSAEAAGLGAAAHGGDEEVDDPENQE